MHYMYMYVSQIFSRAFLVRGQHPEFCKRCDPSSLTYIPVHLPTLHALLVLARWTKCAKVTSLYKCWWQSSDLSCEWRAPSHGQHVDSHGDVVLKRSWLYGKNGTLFHIPQFQELFSGWGGGGGGYSVIFWNTLLKYLEYCGGAPKLFLTNWVDLQCTCMVEALARAMAVARATLRTNCLCAQGRNNLRAGLSTIRTTGTEVRTTIEKWGENW